MNKPKLLLLALVAITLTALGAITVFNFLMGSDPCTDPGPLRRDRAKVEAACHIHIVEAERKALSAIDRRAAEFSSFIENSRSGTRPFAEELVSFYGTWRAAKPYLPFTEANGHEAYVQEQFGRHIFISQELERAARRSINDSLRDLEGIENDLARQLRFELLGDAVACQKDTAKSVGRLAESKEILRIGDKVFLRMSIALDITGAVLLSIPLAIIEFVVSSIWDWIDDPAEDLERETNTKLDNVALVGAQMMRDELSCVVFQRREFWTGAVRENLR